MKFLPNSFTMNALGTPEGSVLVAPMLLIDHMPALCVGETIWTGLWGFLQLKYHFLESVIRGVASPSPLKLPNGF